MAKGKTLGTAVDEIVSALEGLKPKARATAVAAACEYLQIPMGKASSSIPEQLTPPPPPPPKPQVTDIKTLKGEKQHKGAIEMACVVAHYLEELAPKGERKETISTADLRKYFKDAKFKLPAIQYVLPNAKKAGYFDSVGGGEYKLNAVGYNLVVHTLPRNKSES